MHTYYRNANLGSGMVGRGAFSVKGGRRVPGQTIGGGGIRMPLTSRDLGQHREWRKQRWRRSRRIRGGGGWKWVPRWYIDVG